MPGCQSWQHETVQLEANSFSINGRAGPASVGDLSGKGAGAEQLLPWDSTLSRLPARCKGRYADILEMDRASGGAHARAAEPRHGGKRVRRRGAGAEAEEAEKAGVGAHTEL